MYLVAFFAHFIEIHVQSKMYILNLDRINVTKDLEPLKSTRNCTTLILSIVEREIRVTMGCLTYFLLINVYCIVSYAGMQDNFVTTKGYII